MKKVLLLVAIALIVASCVGVGYQPPGPDLWKMP